MKQRMLIKPKDVDNRRTVEKGKTDEKDLIAYCLPSGARNPDLTNR